MLHQVRHHSDQSHQRDHHHGTSCKSHQRHHHLEETYTGTCPTTVSRLSLRCNYLRCSTLQTKVRKSRSITLLAPPKQNNNLSKQISLCFFISRTCNGLARPSFFVLLSALTPNFQWPTSFDFLINFCRLDCRPIDLNHRFFFI